MDPLFGFTPGPDIELPGLKARAPLKRGTLFRYDGEVSSLLHNIARTELVLHGYIQQERDIIGKLLGYWLDRFAVHMGAAHLKDKIPDIETTRAYCFKHRLDHSDAYVIAKQQGLPPALSLFADGHESGHLLEKMGQQSVLQELIDAGGISLATKAFEGEDFADVAGFLALFRSRIRDIPRFHHRQQERKDIASYFIP